MNKTKIYRLLLCFFSVIAICAGCSTNEQTSSDLQATAKAVTTTDSRETVSTAVQTPQPLLTETPIVMVVVYENYAWVEEQEVKIYDSGGSRYFYVYGEGYGEGDDNFLWLDFSKKDWQDTMRKIAGLGSVIEVSDEAQKAISDFSEKYDEGLTKKYKEYESGLRDYGSNKLYGIYYDDGAPKYVLLCQYGNQIKCLDDEDVINFANQMIELGIFPTAHHEDFQY